MTVVIFLMGLTIAVSVWLLVCNERTYRQRNRIIKWVYRDSGGWRERVRWFHAVGYNEHLWALVSCRDPKKLYGESPQ